MRRLLACATGAAIAFAPVPAPAGPIEEIRAGVFAQGAGPLATNKEEGVGLNAELIFNSPNALSFLGSPRPIFGASIATDANATSQIYGGLVWRQDVTRRFFVAAGFGVAVHDGKTDFSLSDPNIATTTYFGCRALFRFSGDIGYMLTDEISASIHYDHISNAGLCDENEGLENSGLRLGYRF